MTSLKEWLRSKVGRTKWDSDSERVLQRETDKYIKELEEHMAKGEMDCVSRGNHLDAYNIAVERMLKFLRGEETKTS